MTPIIYADRITLPRADAMFAQSRADRLEPPCEYPREPGDPMVPASRDTLIDYVAECACVDRDVALSWLAGEFGGGA